MRQTGPLLIVLAIGSATATVGLPAAAHPPAIVSQAAEKAIGDEVHAFRKSMAEAIRTKDAAKLRTMYHPGFSLTRPDGKVEARDERIRAVVAGEQLIEMADARDVAIRVPNDWVAIATGISEMKTVAGGRPSAVKWIAVYTRTDRSWVLVAGQAMRIGEATP